MELCDDDALAGKHTDTLSRARKHNDMRGALAASTLAAVASDAASAAELGNAAAADAGGGLADRRYTTLGDWDQAEETSARKVSQSC